VSGGRIELGMGTGWSEVEHTAYGFPFLSMKERMDVLEEQLAIVHDGHWGDAGFSFHGEHYTLVDLDARPKPVQRPHPPLIMGGAAGPRAARLAARYADEYNTNFVAPEEAGRRRDSLVAACEKAGREPIPFSYMTTTIVAADAEGVRRRVRELGHEPDPGSSLVGTVEQVAERLQAYAAVGVSRVYLQHLLHRDLEAVELIGRELAPAVA
jgi:alkanesulfonate monooxygenase SsuD/methylene tetrahydromethanopterin reductase-like flavin-dependent oxidoreductase (luciferase family)